VGEGGMMSRSKTYLVGLALAVGLSAPRPAAAQTVCTDYISTLPITITASGTYCLTQSINTNIGLGSAISVTGGSSVVIDLRGFTINNLAGGASRLSTRRPATNNARSTT